MDLLDVKLIVQDHLIAHGFVLSSGKSEKEPVTALNVETVKLMLQRNVIRLEMETQILDVLTLVL